MNPDLDQSSADIMDIWSLEGKNLAGIWSITYLRRDFKPGMDANLLFYRSPSLRGSQVSHSPIGMRVVHIASQPEQSLGLLSTLELIEHIVHCGRC